MTDNQERLQMKREPLDKWSIREKLCLATAVMRSGDQNWMSVSRTLKPFGEPNRPADWFHQKNCAAQYGALLEQIETPKRIKKRSESLVETPAESILKNLQIQRQEELKQLLMDEKREYLKLQEDMRLLQSAVSEEQLDAWCLEMEEDEKQKDLDNAEYAVWLKEREQRKQELERAWRPVSRLSLIGQQQQIVAGQKRKGSSENSLDAIVVAKMDGDELKISPDAPTPTLTPTKPALSPLLTSLLKSPSHQQQSHLSATVVSSSILHSAITQQQPRTTPTINPTIASLLNSSPTVTVSPGIQQLVTSAISQAGPIPSVVPILALEAPQTLVTSVSDLLSDSEVPNLKDIEKTISSDLPLPEMKNEEVDTIISDLIDNNDIVTDPETHLLDVNDDDIINSLENELEELANEEKAAAAKAAAAIIIDDNRAIASVESADLLNSAVKQVSDGIPAVTDEETVNLQAVVVLVSPIKKSPSDASLADDEKVKKTDEIEEDEQVVTLEKVDMVDIKEKVLVEIDPFEFQEDPEIQPSKPSAGLKLVTQQSQNLIIETKSSNENILAELSASKITKDNLRHSTETTERTKSITDVIKIDQKEKIMTEQEDKLISTGGSVEIVEVDILEDEENSNETYTSKSSDEKEQLLTELSAKSITTELSSIEQSLIAPITKVEPTTISEKDENIPSIDDTSVDCKDTTLQSAGSDEQTKDDSTKRLSIDSKEDVVVEKKTDAVLDVQITPDVEIKVDNVDVAAPPRNTFTPDYSNSDDIFDDMNIEVKVGKIKRDYSRTKKKEETDFDLLLAVEKAVGENVDDDTSEAKPIKSTTKTPTATVEIVKNKQKMATQENTTDDSNSPWTGEEEESLHMRTRRRYSTPATPIDSVPSSPAGSFDDDHRDYRNWKKAVLLVHGRLAMHKYASLFMKGITNDQAPNYHDLIYRPMDLQTIRKNIDAGSIRTNNEFHRDVLLMFANAIMYNDRDSQIYEMAVEMRKEAQEQIQILFQAQLGGDSGPSRRETRTCPTDQQLAKRKRSSGAVDDVSRILKKRKDE